MVEKLKRIVKESENIVFFGGAGVSTESGIPDFRSEDGVFNTVKSYGFPPETILSHSFFSEFPERFFDYYKKNLIFKDAAPNPAHYALAGIEKGGRLKAVITQNIDGLHQKAGSGNVLELHGSILRNYCMDCRKTYDLDFVLTSKEIVPRCEECKGIVRPDVVLYQEELNTNIINAAIDHISKADTLIIGGTSLVVYPAAGLVQYFRGKNLVLINKSSTQYDRRANLVINDSIGKVMNKLID